MGNVVQFRKPKYVTWYAVIDRGTLSELTRWPTPFLQISTLFHNVCITPLTQGCCVFYTSSESLILNSEQEEYVKPIREDLKVDPYENPEHYMAILVESLSLLKRIPEAVEVYWIGCHLFVCLYICLTLQCPSVSVFISVQACVNPMREDLMKTRMKTWSIICSCGVIVTTENTRASPVFFCLALACLVLSCLVFVLPCLVLDLPCISLSCLVCPCLVLSCLVCPSPCFVLSCINSFYVKHHSMSWLVPHLCMVPSN